MMLPLTPLPMVSTATVTNRSNDKYQSGAMRHSTFEFQWEILLTYIHLAILLAAVYLPQYAIWAMPSLAAINLLFSAMFYMLCFHLLSGLKASSVNAEMDVPAAWTTRTVQIGATAVLLMSANQYFVWIAIFSMPWIILNIFTDAFGTLVKWEILEITDRSEEDD